MSRRPNLSEPTGESVGVPPRVVRSSANRSRLQSLLRFDGEDDPGRGALLYEAVVLQDTAELTGDGWLDRLEAISRIKTRLAALEAETIAGFDDSLRGVSADLGHRYPAPGDRDATAGERRWIAGDLRSVADEVAVILTMRRGHATQRIHSSCELVHNFPATLRALDEDRLTERAAFTLVSELSVLDNVVDLHAAEAAILKWATTHVLTDIKLACRREVALRSPAATSSANERAHDSRSVRMYADDLGRAALVHHQDAVDAAAVMASLSRAALYRRRHGDSRTMDQLRADIALARLLPRAKQVHAEDHSGDPGASDNPTARSEPGTGRQAAAPSSEIMGDEAVLGADAMVVIHATAAEVQALITGREGTGDEADHHGPIPQNSLRKHLLKALARSLPGHHPALSSGSPHDAATSAGNSAGNSAGSGANTLSILGHAGGGGRDRNGELGATPASFGTSRIELQLTDRPPPGTPDRRTPSAALDRYVRRRDRICQFPGCNHGAEFTDLDHRVAFAVGGPTTAGNLWCLCRHHHRLKHEGGWHLHHSPDGTTRWTSPTGRRYINAPTSP